MKVRVDTAFVASAPAGTIPRRFEVVRERVAHVGPPAYHGHKALQHAQVECRAGELIDGAICARCGHLLSARPAFDGHSVDVRCVFFESDPVTTIMTRAVDVVTADVTEPLAVAAARMLDRGVKQVLATDAGAIVGIIPSSEAEHLTADVLAGDHVMPLPVVSRSMTLGALGAALRAQDVDCVAVVDEDELLGVITRGDLRRAGVPGVE